MKNVVIATNLGRLKAYKMAKAAPGRGQKLDLIEDINFVDAHTRFRDQVTDQAGRFHIDGKHPYLTSDYEALGTKREMERRLIREVADEIEAILEREASEGWYMLAGPEIHNALLELIKPELRERLINSLLGDYVKTRPAVVLRLLVEQATPEMQRTQQTRLT